MIKTKHYGVEFNRADLVEIQKSRQETDAFAREAKDSLRKVEKDAWGIRDEQDADALRQVLESEPRTEIPPQWREEVPPRPEIGQQVMHTQNQSYTNAIAKRQPQPPMIYQVPLDRPLLLHYEALVDQHLISGEPLPGAGTQPSPFAPIFSREGQEISDEEKQQLNLYLYGEIPSPSPREESAALVEYRKGLFKPAKGRSTYPYDGPKLQLLGKKVEEEPFVPGVYEKTTVALEAKFAGNKERKAANAVHVDPRSRHWIA